MRARTRVKVGGFFVALMLVGGACGGDDDDDGAAEPSGSDAEASDGDGPDAGDDSADPVTDGGGGAGGGSLTLDGETITLDRARCFLEEQEAAGQTIELTGQGFGTNAAGDEVSIDFTRFAESSMFSGDDISVVIGDPFADDSTSLSTSLDIGGVSLDGSTLSASDFELTSGDGSEAMVASFELNC